MQQNIIEIAHSASNTRHTAASFTLFMVLLILRKDMDQHRGCGKSGLQKAVCEMSDEETLRTFLNRKT